MTYISKKGKAAAESAKTDNSVDYGNYLKTFKSGTTYKVRVPSTEDFVEFFNHSVFKVFYSSPCTGGDDLYCKAVSALYEKANKAKGEEEKEKYLEQARQLKAKPRYFFGFFDLETGEPFVIDVTKNQAQVFINAIEKFEKKIDKKAFEVSKTGTGQNTVVNMIPMDEEDLSDKEAENFQTAADKEFPEDIYGKVLRIKPESEQVKDLQSFGFDLSLIGIKPEDAQADESTEDENVEEEAERETTGPDNF